MKAQPLLCLALACVASVMQPVSSRTAPENFGLRSLLQSASSFASGAQTAFASSTASNINGIPTAQTASSATGGQTTTFGISQAAGEVDHCLQISNSGSSECRTLAPKIRSSRCTDIPPDEKFTCAQQSTQFLKCDQDFVFVGAYCLKSCNRCGGTNCTDKAPADGSACDASKCGTDAYKAAPVCLKTCGRCSNESASA